MKSKLSRRKPPWIIKNNQKSTDELLKPLTVSKVEWAYFPMKATTSLNVLHVLYWSCFAVSKDKYSAAVKSSSSSGISVPALSHGRFNGVVPCLLCLQCPCRYFHSSGRETHFLSAKRLHYKERERERKRESRREAWWEREEGGGASKGRDAKYTHPIFGTTCASISLCVGFTRGCRTINV